MKALFSACFFLLSAASSFAATIDSDLQALLLSPKFPPAAKQANKAVAKLRQNLTVTLGDTTVWRSDGPDYTFKVPVYGVRVPMGPEIPRWVGNIAARMRHVPNSPLPAVLSVSFQPDRDCFRENGDLRPTCDD